MLGSRGRGNLRAVSDGSSHRRADGPGSSTARHRCRGGRNRPRNHGRPPDRRRREVRVPPRRRCNHELVGRRRCGPVSRPHGAGGGNEVDSVSRCHGETPVRSLAGTGCSIPRRPPWAPAVRRHRRTVPVAEFVLGPAGRALDGPRLRVDGSRAAGVTAGKPAPEAVHPVGHYGVHPEYHDQQAKRKLLGEQGVIARDDVALDRKPAPATLGWRLHVSAAPRAVAERRRWRFRKN